MGFGPTIEVFIICQPEKMPVLLGKDEIYWLYYLLSNYLNRKRANQNCI